MCGGAVPRSRAVVGVMAAIGMVARLWHLGLRLIMIVDSIPQSYWIRLEPVVTSARPPDRRRSERFLKHVVMARRPALEPLLRPRLC